MSVNVGVWFASMSEEERRRFAMEQERAQEQGLARSGGKADDELEFDDPRHHHDRTKATLEDRDGIGAQVDDEQHQARVRASRARAAKSRRPPA